jgi:hypothetical protein
VPAVQSLEDARCARSYVFRTLRVALPRGPTQHSRGRARNSGGA